ncbi:hypothetical protein [Shewanella sp. 10N.286.54.B9]|uniref:hypothetical protein n=1 Tax=Shewanella sp. 10N.286.54.B9 TaxID=3229719 RepID=UPI003553E60B
MELATKKQELVERQEYQVFFQDFESNLAKLTEALKSSQNVQQLASDISEKGFWGNAFGGISGRNTKELAGMIENLGASLEVTQSILSIVLKVQNIKNGFLKDFHQALVEKIAHLAKDDRTLDSNQKDAALAIVTKLEQQVSYQLAQSEQIESHQRKLTELDDFVEVKDILDSEQSAKIERLDKTSEQIIQGADTRQQLINELQQKSEIKRKKDLAQDEDINQLSKLAQALQQESEVKTEKDQSQDSEITRLSKQNAALLKIQQQADLQIKSQAELIVGIRSELDKHTQDIAANGGRLTELTNQLEQAHQALEYSKQQQQDFQLQQSSIKAMLSRHALSGLALVIAVAATYLTLQPL